MNIAILGTRGIPNHYGGFEQFAEYLSVGLVKKGHNVTVYNSHNHPYRNDEFNGVKVKHIFDPESVIGTAGQFIYDFFCILHTRVQKYDLILQLGYTSSSVFYSFHPSGSIVVTNMDGLEWKRSKYSAKVQKFLLLAESLAVRKSDFIISDSIGIKNYFLSKYAVSSSYIPYGAEVFEQPNVQTIDKFQVRAYAFNMLVARLEPENSIEMILDGVVLSEDEVTFLVIGNYQTKFGEYLRKKYVANENIKFLGSIYDMDTLNNLRYYSKLYFHGHTVGGTNPSLLEAMGSKALICAHNNEFNKSILQNDAFYFSTSIDIQKYIININHELNVDKLQNNVEKVRKLYSWERIIGQYEYVFQCLLNPENDDLNTSMGKNEK